MSEVNIISLGNGNYKFIINNLINKKIKIVNIFFNNQLKVNSVINPETKKAGNKFYSLETIIPGLKGIYTGGIPIGSLTVDNYPLININSNNFELFTLNIQNINGTNYIGNFLNEITEFQLYDDSGNLINFTLKYTDFIKPTTQTTTSRLPNCGNNDNSIKSDFGYNNYWHKWLCKYYQKGVNDGINDNNNNNLKSL